MLFNESFIGKINGIKSEGEFTSSKFYSTTSWLNFVIRLLPPVTQAPPGVIQIQPLRGIKYDRRSILLTFIQL